MYRSNRITLDIEWAHCDPAGIVWNPRFFEFFDTGTWRLFETVLGVPRAELNARYDLLGLALVSAGATFTSPLKFGDQASLKQRSSNFAAAASACATVSRRPASSRSRAKKSEFGPCGTLTIRRA